MCPFDLPPRFSEVMLFNRMKKICVCLISPKDDSTKTKVEDQTDKYIYFKIEKHHFGKTKGKMRRTHIYTKREDQTDTYIY
jgi:cellobiose-specific phosphotransferase system component IIB